MEEKRYQSNGERPLDIRRISAFLSLTEEDWGCLIIWPLLISADIQRKMLEWERMNGQEKQSVTGGA